MDPVGPKKETSHATIDWTEYRKGRPSYPPSLTNIIYNYRRRHPEVGWNRLVDIGAGSGIASLGYIHDFKTVHISDPGTSNEAQARTFLSRYIDSQNLSTALEFSQRTGEEAYKHVGEGQADMVICATAAHFMDQDGLADSIAKMFKPGGTLAVFSYWFPSFPDESPRLLEAFAKTLDELALKPVSSGDDASQALLAKTFERQNTVNDPLDSPPLPGRNLFDDPMRVHINSSSERAPYRALSRQFLTEKVELGGIPRVQPRDRICRYESGVDAEAEGWSFDADKA